MQVYYTPSYRIVSSAYNELRNWILYRNGKKPCNSTFINPLQVMLPILLVDWRFGWESTVDSNLTFGLLVFTFLSNSGRHVYGVRLLQHSVWWRLLPCMQLAIMDLDYLQTMQGGIAEMSGICLIELEVETDLIFGCRSNYNCFACRKQGFCQCFLLL